MADIDIDVAIEQALDKLAAEAASDFAKTMTTWQTHRPPVTVESSKGLRRVYVQDQIYTYVNDGTPVRHALLWPFGAQRTWTSKTKVGQIQATGGSGGVLKVSKKFNFKGIVPRHFDILIMARITEEVLPPVMEQLANNVVEYIVSTL